MSKRAELALTEARQAMVRVWLAISAVWVAFWLIIAAIIFTTLKTDSFLILHLSVFSFIVATPPVLLLAVGSVSRWVFETFALRSRDR